MIQPEPRMAFPQQLIEVIAVTTGVPASKVGTYLRRLREDGLISQEGRGLSSARMNTRDGMRLVLALAASDTAADAPHAVRAVEANVLADKTANLPGGPFEAGSRLGDVLLLVLESFRAFEHVWSDLFVEVVEGGLYCDVYRGHRSAALRARFIGEQDLDLLPRLTSGKVFFAGRDLRVTRAFSSKTLGAIIDATVPVK